MSASTAAHGDPSRAAVLASVAGLAGELVASSGGRDDHSIHQLRVGLRRLRSLLATYGPMFDGNELPALSAELRWLFRELGDLRDAGVLHDRLGASAGAESAPHPLQASLDRARATGSGRAAVALESPRHAQLLGDLSRVASSPEVVLSPSEHDPRACLREQYVGLRRKLTAAAPSLAELDDSELLHEVRKSAKTLRYSTDVLVPVYGRDARRLVRGTQQLQESLGLVQDCALVRRFLRELSTDATTLPSQAFGLGELHERELRTGLKAQRTFLQHRRKFLDSDPWWLS